MTNEELKEMATENLERPKKKRKAEQEAPSVAGRRVLKIITESLEVPISEKDPPFAPSAGTSTRQLRGSQWVTPS